MPELLTVDRLEVLVLVDNETDSLSTNPNTAVSEWTGLLTGGRLRLLSGRGTCCAHHGLSLLITTYEGKSSFARTAPEKEEARNRFVAGPGPIQSTEEEYYKRYASLATARSL